MMQTINPHPQSEKLSFLLKKFHCVCVCKRERNRQTADRQIHTERLEKQTERHMPQNMCADQRALWSQLSLSTFSWLLRVELGLLDFCSRCFNCRAIMPAIFSFFHRCVWCVQRCTSMCLYVSGGLRLLSDVFLDCCPPSMLQGLSLNLELNVLPSPATTGVLPPSLKGWDYGQAATPTQPLCGC